VSRRDDERVADILDAASDIAGIIEPGREAWEKDLVRESQSAMQRAHAAAETQVRASPQACRVENW
jgi:uncharacterized protein YukE